MTHTLAEIVNTLDESQRAAFLLMAEMILDLESRLEKLENKPLEVKKLEIPGSIPPGYATL